MGVGEGVPRAIKLDFPNKISKSNLYEIGFPSKSSNWFFIGNTAKNEFSPKPQTLFFSAKTTKTTNHVFPPKRKVGVPSRTTKSGFLSKKNNNHIFLSKQWNWGFLTKSKYLVFLSKLQNRIFPLKWRITFLTKAENRIFLQKP